MLLENIKGQELKAIKDMHQAETVEMGSSDPNSFLNNPAVRDITPDTPTSPLAPAPGEPLLGSSPSFFDDLFSGASPFYFGLTFGEGYDDNIFISQQKHGDFITHVAPSVDFVEGDKTAANSNYFNVDFRPTLYFYSRNSDQNRVDYFADLLYQHTWTRLTLSLEQRWDELTGPSIDVGNFFKRDIYTTTLSGSYTVDDKLSLAGTETQRISDFQNLGITSTDEWITDLYANYQVAPKLTVGVGPRFGFVTIADNPGQTYQDLLLRLNYKISEKINLTFDGGAEYRQFDGSPDRIYPIFDLNVSYTPFDGTAVSLSSYRQEVISYGDVGGDYTNTVVQVNAKQRFLGKYFLLASGGYDLADYQQIAGAQPGTGAVAGTTGNRRDNYYFVNVGVEWDPREWLSVSARYQYSQDKSTFETNSFTDNQADIQAALQY
jgi:hypothetical protein